VKNRLSNEVDLIATGTTLLTDEVAAANVDDDEVLLL